MSKVSSFLKKGQEDLVSNTTKAIYDLLDVLDSPIVYPMSQGQVNEPRLLAVVKSRSQAYLSAVKLGDEIGLDRTKNKNLSRRFMSALITTFHEMNEILKRDIRSSVKLDITEDDEVEIIDGKNAELSDDHIAIISKTKEEAYLLNKQILERISILDDPDAANRKKLENMKAPSIVELFAYD